MRISDDKGGPLEEGWVGFSLALLLTFLLIGLLILIFDWVCISFVRVRFCASCISPGTGRGGRGPGLGTLFLFLVTTQLYQTGIGQPGEGYCTAYHT